MSSDINWSWIVKGVFLHLLIILESEQHENPSILHLRFVLVFFLCFSVSLQYAPQRKKVTGSSISSFRLASAHAQLLNDEKLNFRPLEITRNDRCVCACVHQ